MQPLLAVGFCTSLMLVISTITVTAQNAQSGQCFEIYRNTTSGPNGALLLNKCTGQSWALVGTALGNTGTTVRWYPISVEKAEGVLSR